jgi:methylated-DNA-[protein]-cysteine S-methyltransferase
MNWIDVPSPIGPLGVAADDAGIRAVRFDGAPGPSGRHPLLDAAATQLAEYFAGERTGFMLPLAAPGGTDFERAVWAAIAAIPYGETMTYGRIAALVGEPDAARAVGVACNRNPLPVVVPCHRVVGAGNKLVGFGGGLPRKRYLLELEARVCIEHTFTAR